jgi:hypothetical protein
MPSDQRVRRHDGEYGSPLDQLGEPDQCDPRRVIGAARLDLAFSVECQLLAEEEIFGRQLRPRSAADRHERDDVNQQADGGPPHY